MCFPARRRHLRMSVPITFRDQAEHECRDDEQRYSSLNWSEAKSLPHLIEFETLDLFNQKSIQMSVVETVNPLHGCVVRRLLKQDASFMPQRFDRIDAEEIAKISSQL